MSTNAVQRMPPCAVPSDSPNSANPKPCARHRILPCDVMPAAGGTFERLADPRWAVSACQQLLAEQPPVMTDVRMQQAMRTLASAPSAGCVCIRCVASRHSAISICIFAAAAGRLLDLNAQVHDREPRRRHARGDLLARQYRSLSVSHSPPQFFRVAAKWQSGSSFKPAFVSARQLT